VLKGNAKNQMRDCSKMVENADGPWSKRGEVFGSKQERQLLGKERGLYKGFWDGANGDAKAVSILNGKG